MMTREESAAHLAGIRSFRVATSRLDSHVLISAETGATPVVFLHGNLSSGTFFEELMSAMPRHYRCIAPDIRGHGESEDLPIDATRGARDIADDLYALLSNLGIHSAHLAGWSAGAAGIMQFALDHPAAVRSLCLIAPVSPYGFGGSCSVDGTPTNADFSGSGAGAVNPEAVEQLRLRHAQDDAPTAPLHLLRNYFVTPGTQLRREGALLEAMFQQRLGTRRYPGDSLPSPHWPYFAPGRWGLMNSLSPKYFNVSALGDLQPKPPVIWMRGDSDRVISDQSHFDMAALAPGDAASQNGQPVRYQPMIGQMRYLLTSYAKRGGRVSEAVFPGTGHAPFLEEPAAFLRQYINFLEKCQAAAYRL